MEKNNLPSKVKNAKKQIEKLNGISLKFNLSKEEIALIFVNSICEIDKIVIGVEKIEQLKRNIKILNNFKNLNKIKSIINFKDFIIEDENIIDPRKWV